MTVKVKAESVQSQINELYIMLQKTPEDSPFRLRLKQRIEALESSETSCKNFFDSQVYELSALDSTNVFNNTLNTELTKQGPVRLRQDKRNYYAFYAFDQVMHIVGPHVELTIHLFQFNSLDTILQALKLANQYSDDPEITWKIKQVGLFEVTQRLNPGHAKYQSTSADDVDKLSRILFLSVNNIFFDMRTPIGIPGLNPLKYIDHLLLFSDLKISEEQRFLLISSVMAGLDMESVDTYPEYFMKYARVWKKLKKPHFFSRTKESPYDSAINDRLAAFPE